MQHDPAAMLCVVFCDLLHGDLASALHRSGWCSTSNRAENRFLVLLEIPGDTQFNKNRRLLRLYFGAVTGTHWVRIARNMVNLAPEEVFTSRQLRMKSSDALHKRDSIQVLL